MGWQYEDFASYLDSTEMHARALSGRALAFALSALIEMDYRSAWQQGALSESLTDTQWDDIEAAIEGATGELMNTAMIGTLFPCITANIPDGALECNGATYNRVDYPELYAVLHSAFIVDADTFTLPDYRGRVLIGLGTLGADTYSMGNTGGEARHTLTQAEIPSHSHSIPGTITSLAVEPGELPVLDPNLIPGATGNTGGDTAHENRQPFGVARICVWAR